MLNWKQKLGKEKEYLKSYFFRCYLNLVKLQWSRKSLAESQIVRRLSYSQERLAKRNRREKLQVI